MRPGSRFFFSAETSSISMSTMPSLLPPTAGFPPLTSLAMKQETGRPGSGLDIEDVNAGRL